MYSLIVDSPWFNILWSVYCLYCIVSPIQYAHSWTSALTAHCFGMSFRVLSRQSQHSHPSKPSSPFSYTTKFCLMCSLWWCLPSLNNTEPIMVLSLMFLVIFCVYVLAFQLDIEKILRGRDCLLYIFVSLALCLMWFKFRLLIIF